MAIVQRITSRVRGSRPRGACRETGLLPRECRRWFNGVVDDTSTEFRMGSSASALPLHGHEINDRDAISHAESQTIVAS